VTASIIDWLNRYAMTIQIAAASVAHGAAQIRSRNAARSSQPSDASRASASASSAPAKTIT
jgi:hypothetical protein